MGDLTVSQIIKLILGIFVVVAVIVGVYLIFKERIFEFFSGAAPIKIFLGGIL